MNKQRDFVLRSIEDRGVRFVRLWFTDVSGQLKSVSLAPAEVEGAFSEGIGFDGSAIEGLTRSAESDLLLQPDPSTFQILPFRNTNGATARMFCNVHTPNGEPAPSDPRYVLKRQLDHAAELGFTFYTHPEIEFYLFKSAEYGPEGPIPVDQAGYFDNVPGGTAHDFRRDSVEMLEELGISVEFSHHEGGHGQNEIDLRYADALTTADNIVTFRTVVKEVAIAKGVHATFMPKPLSNQPGSGMHSHLSLFEGDENAFYDPAAKYQLSQTGRRFMAGILQHAKEITAITSPHVNSYKRLWGGHEAPSYICWGHNNTSALVRVPMYKPGKGGSARIEYRGLDSAANPYLAYAALLAAGLKGIEEEYELPTELEDEVYDLSRVERRAMEIASLPSSLDDAVRELSNSELMADTLGEQVFNYYIREKKRQVSQYRAQITPWEMENLFIAL